MFDEWMKVDVGLPDNKKIVNLMGLVGDPHPARVIGWVVCLWCWARRSGSDGHIMVTDHVVNNICGCPLTRDQFIAVFCHQQVGLLEDCGGGVFWIHDWDEHHDRWLEIQRQNANRQRKRRERLREVNSPEELTDGCDEATEDEMSRVTSQEQSRTSSVTVTRKSKSKNDDDYDTSSSGVLRGHVIVTRDATVDALEALMPGSMRREHLEQLQNMTDDFGKDEVLECLKDMRARGISRSGVFPYLRKALKSAATEAAKTPQPPPTNNAFAEAQAELARYQELTKGGTGNGK